MREQHGREPLITGNFPTAGTGPGTVLGTDEVRPHSGPTELTPAGASALPLPFEALEQCQGAFPYPLHVSQRASPPGALQGR